MYEFDANDSGGYRDMLINVVCLKTKHVCEVQVTLKPLLAVKVRPIDSISTQCTLKMAYCSTHNSVILYIR